MNEGEAGFPCSHPLRDSLDRKKRCSCRGCGDEEGMWTATSNTTGLIQAVGRWCVRLGWLSWGGSSFGILPGPSQRQGRDAHPKCKRIGVKIPLFPFPVDPATPVSAEPKLPPRIARVGSFRGRTKSGTPNYQGAQANSSVLRLEVWDLWLPVGAQAGEALRTYNSNRGGSRDEPSGDNASCCAPREMGCRKGVFRLKHRTATDRCKLGHISDRSMTHFTDGDKSLQSHVDNSKRFESLSFRDFDRLPQSSMHTATPPSTCCPLWSQTQTSHRPRC